MGGFNMSGYDTGEAHRLDETVEGRIDVIRGLAGFLNGSFAGLQELLEEAGCIDHDAKEISREALAEFIKGMDPAQHGLFHPFYSVFGNINSKGQYFQHGDVLVEYLLPDEHPDSQLLAERIAKQFELSSPAESPPLIITPTREGERYVLPERYASHDALEGTAVLKVQSVITGRGSLELGTAVLAFNAYSIGPAALLCLDREGETAFPLVKEPLFGYQVRDK